MLGNEQARRHANSPLKTVPLTIVGFGGVGRELLRQILVSRQFHRERFQLTLAVNGLADRRGFLLFEPEHAGDDRHLWSALKERQQGNPLPELSSSGSLRLGWREFVEHHLSPGSIVVDCTASSETTPLLRAVLQQGGKIVLANKKPLTGPLCQFEALTGDPRTSRWETTVGSSTPIVGVVSRILASGDRVSEIMGSVSGTLGLLTSGLRQGKRFSSLVHEAWTSGATEPDPREDLGGIDVARKALILSRMLGQPLNLQDIHPESLVPKDFQSLSLADFFQRLPELDLPFKERVRSISARGKALRYLFRLTEKDCKVGLFEVDAESPLGQLQGSENLVQIHSGIYAQTPLVIQGRGSGVGATASGLLSDILDLAFTAEHDFPR